MSSKIERADRQEPPEREQGPSLTLLYTILAVALLAAIALAALIVLPFYRRRHF